MPLEKNPFFIVGSGRSGTTLLRVLLCRHSRIHIPPETWFILDLVRQLPCDQPLNQAQLQRAIDIITNSYRWPDFQLDPEALRDQAAALPRSRLADVIDLVYASLNPAGKPCFGDKTPPYIRIVPQLLQLYPDAKFIHLIRDGRDVAISFLDLHSRFYDEGTRFYEGSKFEWTSAVRLASKYRESQYAGRILDVRYENLIADPASTLAGICCFLEEKFESQMLEPQLQEALVPEREKRMHTKLTEPLSTAALEAWRKKLSPFECFAMESCLANELQGLGYPLRFAAPAWRMPLNGFGLFLRASAPILARGLSYLRGRGLLPVNVYF